MVSSVICLVYADFCLDIAIYDKPDTRRLASMLDVIENNYHEYAFPLLAVLIWSINAVVSKLTTAIDPAAISLYRWLLALIALTPFVLPGVLRNWAGAPTGGN